MNDQNIAELCDELDKISQYVSPDNSIFTSKWIADEYKTVTDMQDRGRPSHRNEYRIIKTLIDASLLVLTKHKDKLAVFVPVCKIIRKIEKSIVEIFESEKSAKAVVEEMNKLLESSV